MNRRHNKILSLLLMITILFTCIFSSTPVFAAEGDTNSISVSTVMKETGLASNMYSFDSAVVKELSDGSYLLKVHQTKNNRNVLALTDSIATANDNGVTWYKADSTYTFVIPIPSIDSPITFCMSSEAKIEAGNDFSNPIVMSFDKDSMVGVESDFSSSDIMTISKPKKTKDIAVSTVMKETGLASGMYTFDNAYVTEVSDGYIVSVHQNRKNRNVLAMTDDSIKAKAHDCVWYKGGGDDGYNFVFKVSSLDDSVTFCMSSEARIETGEDFSNPIVLSFDKTSLTDSEKADLTEDDINIIPVEENEADYTAVTNAISSIPEDLTIYTDETVLALNSSVAAVQYGLKESEQERVDSFAQEILLAISNLELKPVIEEGISLDDGVYIGTVTTDSKMFKVTDLILKVKDGTMNGVITLSGTGYDKLYMGLAENVSESDAISYVADENGKYTFDIPVEIIGSEICVAAHSVKNDNWIDRKITVDSDSLKPYVVDAGDYEVTVTTDSKMFKIVSAILSSDGLKMNAVIALSGTGYDKLYMGLAENANDTDAISYIVDENGKYTFNIPVEILDRGLNVAAHSVKNDNWIDRLVTFDYSSLRKIERELEDADYTAVTNAISSIPEDLTIYTDETVLALTEAVNAVEYDLKEDEQDRVDSFAQSILTAIANLELKTVVLDGAYMANVTTDSSMFKVVSCILDIKDGVMKAKITLSGTGYDKLYMGLAENVSEEDAISYTENSDGKYEFEIPVSGVDKEISLSAHAVKSDSWKDRVITIDGSSLVPYIPESGDYEVSVTSNSSMFKVVNAILSSDGVKMNAVITLSGTGYDMLYVGLKEDANESDAIPYVADENGKYTFNVPVEILDRGLNYAAHSVKNDNWLDRVLTYDYSSLKLVEESDPDDSGNDDSGNSGSSGNGSSKEDIDKIINGTTKGDISDGTHTPSFGFTGGTGKLQISCPSVTVSNGKATARLEISSANITWVKVNGVKYMNNNPGVKPSVFNVPVTLNEPLPITLETTTMSTPHEIDYTLYIYVNGKEASEIIKEEEEKDDVIINVTENNKNDEPDVTPKEEIEKSNKGLLIGLPIGGIGIISLILFLLKRKKKK